MNISELKKDVVFWVSGDSTKSIDFTDADILRSINAYYDEATSLILKADGRWEFDDENLTTLPVATTDLVSGQADYEISGETFLNLLRVEIKDANGNGVQLQPLDQDDKIGVAMTEWAKTNAQPTCYDKVGNSIILYPTPNYSSTGGLKTYYQRPVSLFTSAEMTTGTKTPGFNPLYHRYLSMGAAVDYCSVNSINDRLQILLPKMAQMKTDIIASYSRRNKDERPRMKLARESYSDEGGSYSEDSVG